MSQNVYLMPAITRDSPTHPGRTEVVAKYLDDLTSAGIAASQMIYGAEESALVFALDVPAQVHSTLGGHADCTVVPDLGQNVGAQLAQVQAALEGLNLPAQWVDSTFSYGSVVRFVAVFFLLMQRWQGLGKAKLLAAGVTLDTTFNQLPAGVKTDLQELATSFGFNTDEIAGGWKLRRIFKHLADQWPAVSIFVSGGVL